MKLCIAEKPSVAGEIAKIIGAGNRKDGYYEGNGYWVSWTFGHLCSLKEPHDYVASHKAWDMYSLPILPKEFGIKLIQNKGVEKQFNTIKRLVADCEEIINCGDAGQEGELIQRWVIQLAECKVPVKRLWISSLTEEAIKTGFKKLLDAKEFDSLFKAGECRAISDWLYGINATRLFTMKYGKNKQVLSVGRVQTPTLAMIVDRYFEIKNFVPQTYFELKTNYREAIFSYAKGKIDEEEKAKKLLEEVKDQPLTITKVSIKEGKEFPPNLFDLTSLQIEANNKLSLSAENTLSIVQSLYEKKVVTYPRVDTVFLPNDMYPKIKGMMEGLVDYKALVAPLLEKKIAKSKKVFNDNKVTDHHAIVPTGVIANNIAGLEKDVYDLITRRFIAAFYPECKVSNTAIDATVGKHGFKATGKQILEPGWRVVFDKETKVSKEEKEEKEEDKILPHFEEGESGPHKPVIDKKKTSPPKEYTEATLLRAMETAGKAIEDDELKALMKENGIGRPSTRANIIETLFKRTYIEKKGKKLLPTEIGINLIGCIQNPTLKSPELTGLWEKKLRQIESGEFSAPQFIKEMEAMVDNMVKEVIFKRPTPVEQKPLLCPKCKKGKIIKGKAAYGCSEWKGGCDFRVPFEVLANDDAIKLLINNGKVTLKGKVYLLEEVLK
ncbi:MAG: DNA topoisomerase 3 [Flavobacteriales bacterium]